ncbi:MAG: ferrous iron transport protein B [Bacillota bacterium]|jgi:ferrous iron transport protein B
MLLNLSLVGNPNSGKSTIFNELTGLRQGIGNWPGVTVAVENGSFIYGDYKINIADLPGIYSLFPHSKEQEIACQYLMKGNGKNPHIIINVVDAGNLERNLYLTSQLLEMGLPVLVVLNMYDEVEKQGLEINLVALSQALGVPCVKLEDQKRKKLNHLLDLAIKMASDRITYDSDAFWRNFSQEIREKQQEIANSLPDDIVPHGLKTRWIAEQILEGHWRGYLHQQLKADGDNWETIVSTERYKILEKIVQNVLKKRSDAPQNLTEAIDRIVCNRFFALPIFFLLIFSILFIAFGPPGKNILLICSKLFLISLPAGISSLLQTLQVSFWLHSLVVDGIIAGVGGILVFLPQLAIMFFFLAFLEESGYMSRAAFLTDKMLSRFGLGGTSFIPMILGFGCSVPAIFSCRILNNDKERFLTMLAIPFMSCSSRLPIYALFSAAFFSAYQGLIIFSLYFLGVTTALLTVLLLRPLFKKHSQSFFLMEMPKYRIPAWHDIGRRVWMRTWEFITRAGTLILLASVIIWFLSHFSFGYGWLLDGQESSILQWLGKLIAPLFAPLGFDQWQTAVSLVTGFMSKETVVSSLNILYSLPGNVDAAAKTLSTIFTPLAAYSFMVFVLLYTPCVATIGALKRESASWHFAGFAIVYQLLVAWLVSFVIYRIGSFFGLG